MRRVLASCAELVGVAAVIAAMLTFRCAAAWDQPPRTVTHGEILAWSRVIDATGEPSYAVTIEFRDQGGALAHETFLVAPQEYVRLHARRDVCFDETRWPRDLTTCR